MAYSALERNFSMEDIAGWTANFRSFGRSDSEAQFQEFLKRIPSQPNLQAANQSLEAAALQQFQQQGTGSLQENMYAGPTLGLPRVPSLEFLRQLAHAQQLASAVPSIKPEQLAVAAGPPLPALNQQANFGPLPLPALAVGAATDHQQGVGQPQQHEHAAAVAAHTLNQFSKCAAHSAHSEGTSEPSSNDKDDGGPKEGRKARRMLSNRESARRSRRRKQEHLSKLEQEINGMMEDKKAWTEQAASLERRCKSADDENRRLKEENERLRDELQFLRSELKELHSYARRTSLYKKDDSSGSRKRPMSDPAETQEGAL